MYRSREKNEGKGIYIVALAEKTLNHLAERGSKIIIQASQVNERKNNNKSI